MNDSKENHQYLYQYLKQYLYKLHNSAYTYTST